MVDVLLINLEVVDSDLDTLILRPLEDLKMENVHDFLAFVISRLSANKKVLIIDFSNVTFVDSPGVGAMLRLLDVMRERNGKFYVFGMSNSLNTIFRLSGLLKLFDKLDRDEAAKNFPGLVSNQ